MPLIASLSVHNHLTMGFVDVEILTKILVLATETTVEIMRGNVIF